MSARFGEWYREGESWVRQEKTTRPLRRIREEAAIGLTAGLIGLTTWSDDGKATNFVSIPWARIRLSATNRERSHAV